MVRLQTILIFIILASYTHLSHKRKVLVYLHGMGTEPLKSESKIIEVLKRFSKKNNFILYTPKATSSCHYIDPTKKNFKCWNHLDIKGEINRISKLYTKNQNVTLVGFSNGGYLLGGALQRGLLNNVSTVAIISGGAIGNIAPNKSIKPKVYIEVATRDRWNKDLGTKLNALLSKKKENRISFRKIVRDHFPMEKDFESFLQWIKADN